MYEELTRGKLEESLREVVLEAPDRRVRIWTNESGLDMFHEQLQLLGTGKKRVWIGRKIPRYLHKLNFKIYKGRKGYYKLV